MPIDVRRLVRGVVAAVLMVLLSSAATAAADPLAPPPPGAALAAPSGGAPRIVRELPDERTAESQTFLNDDGSRTTKVFPVPVNYREPDGSFAPIDNTLSDSPRSGFALRNGANGYVADLPSSLDRSIRFAVGSDWLTFALVGGAGKLEHKGDSASYHDAQPSVDAHYEAQATGLKETLVLADASAPTAYRFRLTTSAGLRLEQEQDGGVLALRGKVRVARFEAPYAWDAAGHGAQEAERHARLAVSADGRELVLTVDAAWLHDPARRFPVSVDPTITYVDAGAVLAGGLQDTFISEGAPGTRYGDLTTLEAGRGTTGGVLRARRSLLKFDVASAIPDDSIVFSATLGAYLLTSSTTNPSPLHVHEMSTAWTEAATWNTYNGTAAWPTPGGESGPATAAIQPPSSGWTYFKDLGDLAQRWVDGTTPNRGVAIDTTSLTADNVYTFTSSNGNQAQWPYLQIWYTQRSGTARDYTFWHPDGSVTPGAEPDHPSTEATRQVSLNIANGNLLVRAEDRNAGPGEPGLRLDRWYNSVWWGPGSFARGWTGETSTQDVRIHQWADGSVVVYLPSYTPAHFRRRADGTFDPARGVNATLIQATDGSGKWNVTMVESGQQYQFASLNAPGSLYTDPSGDTTQWWGWGTGNTGLQAWASNGNKAYFTGGNIGSITQIDAGDGLRSYVYQSSNLTTYTAPDGAITTYEYQPYGTFALALKRIIAPDGSEQRFTYGTGPFDPRRVASYTTRAAGATTDGPTWRFAYGNRTTTVTSPTGTSTTYTWNAARRVIAPDTAAPAFADTNGNDPNTYYVASAATTPTFGVPAVATDEISGIRTVRLERNGTLVAEQQQTCSTAPGTSYAVCPRFVRATFALATSGLAAGVNAYTLKAIDGTGKTTSQTVNLIRDVTAPPTPTGLSLLDYDPVSATTTIGIDAPDDPDVATGVPGSGLQTAQVRYRTRPSTTWSAWVTLTDYDAELASTSLGNVIDLEARSVDRVGNVSGSYAGTVTVVANAVETDLQDEASRVPSTIDFHLGTTSIDVPFTAGASNGGERMLITLSNGSQSFTVSTDGNSVAHFVNLPAGTYTVTRAGSDSLNDYPLEASSSAQFSALATGSVVARGATVGDAFRDACNRLTSAVRAYSSGLCDLKDAELDFFRSKPAAFLYGLFSDRNRAVATTARLWPSISFSTATPSPDGTRANAFQHSYWNELMTKRAKHYLAIAWTVHDDTGYKYADAHESTLHGDLKQYNDLTPANAELRRKSLMDRHNNMVGYYSGLKRDRQSSTNLCLAMRSADIYGQLGRTGATKYQLYWIYSRLIDGSNAQTGAFVAGPAASSQCRQ
jgi:YD repeat-containing protein